MKATSKVAVFDTTLRDNGRVENIREIEKSHS
jgi:hypothetical protein